MNLIDWIILTSVLAFIVIYGAWKTRKSADLSGYLLGNRESKWWVVGLSVMATQASAITFLSTPGQAFSDGMRFVQFYFGLPLAMIVLCISFIPLYYKLKVYTAYEFLESRFDVNARVLTSVLFLIQRGLAAGITIYAPAIILSSILDWNLTLTNIVIGSLVIIYTVSGGTKAVSTTHKLQMFVIFSGMIFAFIYLVNSFGEIPFTEALHISGLSGKMQVIDLSLDLDNRYTLWSGLIGGFFLALSYFGTDQSQVQRYLTARSVKESRMGLLFNAALKVPMQFFILLVGVMVFVFYQFNPAPIFFNENTLNAVENSDFQAELAMKQDEYDALFQERKTAISELLTLKEAEAAPQSIQTKELRIATLSKQEDRLREDVRQIIQQVDPAIETNDRDYVFLYFILNQLPVGLIGLLLAVILSAAMSSTAAELNALASTTTVDIYKRLVTSEGSDIHYVTMSRLFTLGWGLLAITFAVFSNLFENLIQYVNIVGSLFYGTILGIFLVAFYFKKIGGRAVVPAALISEVIVFGLYFWTSTSYLWYNVIGCINVILLAHLIQFAAKPRD